MVFLLHGCAQQPSEETLPADTQTTIQPTTHSTLPVTEPTVPTTQPETTPTEIVEDDIPMFVIPPEQETEPQPTQPREDEKPDPSRPAETTPPENTEPAETTPPTEPSNQPGLDDDELPPIIL